MVRLKGAYCQVKVSYGYRNGKGGKVVHNAETSKARLGLWSFLTKWDSFGDKTAIFWIVSGTTLSKHLQASNGYVQSLTCSNGYNGLSTAMDFTSVRLSNSYILVVSYFSTCTNLGIRHAAAAISLKERNVISVESYSTWSPDSLIIG